MHRYGLAMALLGMLAGAGRAAAKPVVYTATEHVSGILGGAGFTDAFITQKYTGDTANITAAQGVTGFQITGGTLTISVAGFPTATVQDNVAIVLDTTRSQLFFADLSAHSNSFFLFNQPAFASYDLSTSIGPLGGTILNQRGEFLTDQGILQLDSGFSSPQFTARVLPSPEPSALALAGIGAVAALGDAWRRRRRPAA